jgi:hypothetical protein
MTPLEQAIADLGTDITSITTDHIAQLLQIQAEVQHEHDVQQALGAYQLALQNWQLNNQQRGWYGLPLLPRPEPEPMLVEFFKQAQNSAPDRLTAKQAYYAGIREGLRRVVSGPALDRFLAAVNTEEQNAIAGPS